MPDFIEKVYGKENIEDYQKVMSEQTTMLDYKPFVEFTEKQRINLFTSVSNMGIDVIKIIFQSVILQKVEKRKYGCLGVQQLLVMV